MVTISKKFKVAMAHRLTGHDGLCKNLHGHTYSFEIKVKNNGLRETESEEGMVMDFAILSKLVKDAIVEKFDHALLINRKGDALDRSLMELDVKKVIMSERTTTENLSKLWWNLLDSKLHGYGASLLKITIWESPNNKVEYDGGTHDVI